MGTNARVPETVSKAVSEELRVIRARLPKESLRDLAERCKVPYSTLHKTLAGDRMIDVEELDKVARGLRTTGSAVLAEVERKLGEGGATIHELPTPKPPRNPATARKAARGNPKKRS